jgi:hypothetical protein
LGSGKEVDFNLSGCVMITAKHSQNRVDFGRITQAAKSRSLQVVKAFLPYGRLDGQEWVARNPTRADAKPGSFKVNIATGKWADFAIDDRGGDLIALVAYLEGLPQAQAAIRLAEALSVNPYEGGSA